MSDHIVRSYDRELDLSSVGGSPKWAAYRRTIAFRRDGRPCQPRPGTWVKKVAADARLDALQRDRDDAILTIARRQPMAIDLRECVAAFRIAGISSGSATWPRTLPNAPSKIAPGRQLAPRSSVSGPCMNARPSSSRMCWMPMPQRDVDPGRAPSGLRDVELDALEDSVFRDLHLHDGRSAQHHLLHPSAVLFQEHRTHRRPYDQHRRTIIYLVTARQPQIERRRAQPPGWAAQQTDMDRTDATYQTQRGQGPRVLVVEDEQALGLLLAYNPGSRRLRRRARRRGRRGRNPHRGKLGARTLLSRLDAARAFRG